MVSVFDNRQCALGEGVLWHPLRQQLFWFDILGKRLCSQQAGVPQEWQFDEYVSAAGWVDEDRLLIASETQLFFFDVETGESTHCIPLEANDKITRSNDGCTDPYGGFWISTMGKNAEVGRGSIYRYFGGQIKCLFSRLSIPNAICFSSDDKIAYFTDSITKKILSQKLDQEGWPLGQPQTFVDLSSQEGLPDGATTDAEGYLWVAMWGAGNVLRISPNGELSDVIVIPAPQVTCPTFGGKNLSTLYITSAAEGLSEAVGLSGQVFSVTTTLQGRDNKSAVIIHLNHPEGK